MRRKGDQYNRLAFDYAMLLPVLMLTGIGIAMVYSASSELALKQYGNEYFFFKRQLSFAGIGLLAMLLCRYVPYRLYYKLNYLVVATALALLAAVLISSVGHTAGGATRWLNLGWFHFQPVELARLSLIIFLAYSLSKKQDRVEEFKVGFVPHVIILGLFAGLILLQPDFGSTVIFCMLTWIIMYAGRVRMLHLLSACIVVAPAILYVIFSSKYRSDRILIFLDPWRDPLNTGYQIIHSLMAFGSGGIWGKGFGRGYQKLFYLPTPHTDFIFSVIGEEGGLRWVVIVLCLFMIILWRGISISVNTREFFGSILALGLTVSIAIQAVVNMGVCVSLLPTKGLTLPFLSYGGSAMIMNMACIGILMNIWAYNRT